MGVEYRMRDNELRWHHRTNHQVTIQVTFIMDLEKEPFLEDDGASGDESSFAHSGKSLRGRLWSIVHIVFITVYTGIFVLSTRGQCALQTSLHRMFHGNLRALLAFVLIQTAIDNLVVAAASKPYDDFEQSPYAGLPSPSIDAAWHYLLEHTTIRVTPTELNRSNQTSVELPGGGYMAWLGVFHELHCIVSQLIFHTVASL